MNNVIHFDAGDWYTMRQIKESVRFMKTADPKKYKLAIDKESECFDELLKKTAVAA